jgi:hypothetical protein
MAGVEDELMYVIVHVFDAKVKRKPWKVEDFLRSVVRKFLVTAASHDPVFRLGNAWHSKQLNTPHVFENVHGKHTRNTWNSNTENSTS